MVRAATVIALGENAYTGRSEARGEVVAKYRVTTL